MLRRLAALVLGTLVAFVLLAVVLRLLPRPPLSQGYPSGIAVYDDHRRLLRLSLAPDDKYRLWLPLGEFSPTLIDAVLLHEDRHFYRHFAVNPVALVRAVYSTYLSGTRRVGGSTIPMQVARLRYGMNSRSLRGKLVQIVRAVELELRYSKAEILEAYLNLVPCGKNIEGAGAASLIYFGKPARRLNLPESLTLAVIPQSPTRRDPRKDEGQALFKARAALYAKWAAARPGKDETRDEALMRLPIALRSTADLPFRAPHAVDSLLAAAARSDDKADESHELVTTLDYSLQQLVERQLKAYVSRQRRIGLRNAAALLIDTRDVSVKALVGSADFFDTRIEGQVNGVLAKRSPGSTLKPFIYALAIDQGVLHPQTLLKDAPLSFGTYSPENFDGRFAGPLSAEDALIRSRNVPALAVAARLSSPSLYAFLKSAGVSRLKSEEHYGLALVLGGAEVSMEELGTLYAALASRGVLRPLRYLKRDPVQPGVRVLSDEASFITTEMLKHNPRPETGLSSEWLADVVKVAWKTGTSYGFHDAWTAGIVGPYVLVVWLGNFDGESNPALVGVTAAAPLFFHVVDALHAQHRELTEPVQKLPRGVSRVAVCALSGQLPGKHCTHTKQTWFVPGKSPIETCQIHRAVEIDVRTGLRACSARGQTRTEVFEFWPSDLMRLFRQAGLPRRVPPPPGPGCDLTAASAQGSPPRITSPLRGVVYTLRPELDQHDSIGLAATTDADAAEVFWFINDTLLGRSRSGVALTWKPRPGTYIVRAVDDQGRSDSREVAIQALH